MVYRKLLSFALFVAKNPLIQNVFVPILYFAATPDAAFAIDEIAVKKRHKYLTVVMDLHSGRIIFVGDGKGADALLPFWKRLKRSRTKIIAVCSDMSSAYTSAIRSHLPEANESCFRRGVWNKSLSKVGSDTASSTTDTVMGQKEGH